MERVQAHVHEDNTVTNLESGLTLREGPDSFLQTTYFSDDGQGCLARPDRAAVSAPRVRGTRSSVRVHVHGVAGSRRVNR